MSRKLVSLALCLALGGVAYAFAPASIARDGPKWEYKVVNQRSLLDPAQANGPNNPAPRPLINQVGESLSKLGDEGWELVAVAGQETRAAASHTYYLKRRK